MNNQPPPPRTVVFLDTNTLHYLSLFIRFARDKNFTVNDIGDVRLSNRIDQEDEAGYKGSLRKGESVASFVHLEDAQVQCSHISMVELLCGRIRGAAIERLAKEGVPERMWSRIDEREISERSGADLPEIRERVEALPTMLDDWNISLTILIDDDQLPQACKCMRLRSGS